MARKKKKPLPLVKKPGPQVANPGSGGSGSGAWFGTEDRLTDASSQKMGDVGAGLSAPNYTQPGETTAGVDSPAQAFIAAVRANDKAAIKTTYAALPQSGPAGIAAAYEIKDAFFNGSAADRATFKANVGANREVFPAKNYADFQTMMTMTSGAVESGMRWMVGPRPKPEAKPPADPVGLEGKDALAQMSAMAGGSAGKTGLAGAITREATRLGIAPVDLATAIGYETIGTFNPSIRGGAGNHYVGLIQFGPAEQKHYGIVPGMSADDQMVKVGDFLRDRGLKPGMGLLDIYSTINAGSPGHYGWKDASGKTVRQHVAEMQVTYGPRAERLLAGDLAGAAASGVVAGGNVGGDSGRIGKAIQASGGLRKGSRDTAANKAIQRFLVSQAVGDRIGAPLKVDGAFGNRTKEAVKNYQARNDLKPDGVVGPETFKQMNADMTPPGNAGSELVGNTAGGRAFGVGAGAMPGSRDYAAGAAAAAVTVDPHIARAFVPSGKATLMAALDHPDETFTSSNREWDPAAARIAGTLRDAARMDAEVQAAKGRAGKTQFAPPIEGDAGVKVLKSFSDWLGGGANPNYQEHQAPQETGLAADAQRAMDSISRGFDVEHWMTEPTVQDSPYNSSSSFNASSDPYRPTGGYEPGGSSSSGSFDDFAAGMSSTYQTVQGGGSVWTPPTNNYEPGGSNTTETPTTTIPTVSGFPG